MNARLRGHYPTLGLWLATVLIVLSPTIVSLVVHPLTYTNLPLPVVSPVHAGGDWSIEVGRCNGTPWPVSYTAVQQLESDDGRVISLAPTSRSLAPGCSTITSVARLVPIDTPPGRYRMTGVVQVVEVWHTYLVPFDTTWFEIIR